MGWFRAARGRATNDDLAQTRLGTILRAGAAPLAASPPATAGLPDGFESRAARAGFQLVGTRRCGCGSRPCRESWFAGGRRAYRRLRPQRYCSARFHPLFAASAVNLLKI